MPERAIRQDNTRLNIRLEGERILVTGGSSGNGAAIVKELSAAGTRVAIGASRHAKQANQMAQAIRVEGCTVQVIVAECGFRKRLKHGVSGRPTLLTLPRVIR